MRLAVVVLALGRRVSIAANRARGGPPGQPWCAGEYARMIAGRRSHARILDRLLGSGHCRDCYAWWLVMRRR